MIRLNESPYIRDGFAIPIWEDEAGQFWYEYIDHEWIRGPFKDRLEAQKAAKAEDEEYHRMVLCMGR